MSESVRRGDRGLGKTPSGGNAGSYVQHERGAAIPPTSSGTAAAQITREQIVEMADRGEFVPWAKDLKERFEVACAAQPVSIQDDPDEAIARVDEMDFLLRAVEDDAANGEQFRDGSDPRLTEYMNRALSRVHEFEAHESTQRPAFAEQQLRRTQRGHDFYAIV